VHGEGDLIQVAFRNNPGGINELLEIGAAGYGRSVKCVTVRMVLSLT